MDISKFRIRGLTAGSFTPFKPNGDLNLEIMDTFVDKLLNDGVRSVFVCGTASEGTLMTVEERKLVAEKWVQAGKNKLDNVIVHVGGSNLREAKDLAQHAQTIGASAISSLSTVFLRPKNVQSLVEYLKELSESAPNIPLYYYHIPGLSGVNLCMEELLDAIGDRIPTFRGMKYTAPDLQDFGRCVAHSNGKYDMLYGNDESILAALAFGGKGFVGSTYNYSGKMCNRVIEAFNKGDLETARTEMFKVQAFVSVLKKHGGSVDVNKCIMVLSGLDVGPPRSPFIEFTKEKRENLRRDLEAVGFFDLI